MDSIIIILEVIIIALGAVSIALLIKLGSGNGKDISQEIGRNREELSAALGKVTDRLTAMTKENYESRIALSESLNDKLNVIRTQNTEQNEKQTAVAG